MGTRSTFIFEIFRYPGRDKTAVTLFVYKHHDTDPPTLQPVIVNHWKKAREQFAADMNSYSHHPQISLCQAVAGLMLADAQSEFRIAEEVSDDSEYVYRFRQTSKHGDDMQLTVTSKRDASILFEGNYQRFANFWFG